MLEVAFILFIVGVLLLTYVLYRWYKQDETEPSNASNKTGLTKTIQQYLNLRRQVNFSIVMVELLKLDQFDQKMQTQIIKRIEKELQNVTEIKGLSQVRPGTFGLVYEGEFEIQESFVKKLQALSHKTIIIKKEKVKVNLAIGVNCFPEESSSVQDIMGTTFIILRQAKHRPKHTLVYTKENYEEVKHKEKIYQAFQDAFDRGEFHLTYLPEIELTTGKVIRVEALLRWNSPKLGKVSPADFIPIAEELDMIYSVAKWVLNEAMKHAKLWKEKDIHLPISINISSKQLENEDFIYMIERGLSYYNLEPSSVIIEMPEVVLRDRLRLKRKLAELDQLGVQLMIDDFGSDFSALGMFQDTSFKGIKIDPAFLSSVPEDKAATGILRMILRTAQSIGLEVVAKGIETKRQRDVLIRENCLYGQGYLFSKPLEAEKVPQYVRVSSAKIKA